MATVLYYSKNLPLDYTPKRMIEKKPIVQKEIPEHLKPYTTHVCNDECNKICDTCPEICGLPSRIFKSKCLFINIICIKYFFIILHLFIILYLFIIKKHGKVF